MSRRVVVTGIGALTPIGNTAEKSWESAIKGQSGIDRISLFDASEMSVQIAGEVKDFNPDDFISPKEQKRMDRFTLLSLAATEMAIQDSGLEFTEEIKENTGTIIGAGMGGLPLIEASHNTYRDKGHSRICLLYTSPSPRDATLSRMPSSA